MITNFLLFASIKSENLFSEMLFIHVSFIRNEVKHVFICILVSVNFPSISLQHAPCVTQEWSHG